VSERPTPLGAVSRGLAAGLLGTVAMTGWQLLAAKLQSSGDEPEPSPTESAINKPPDPWAEASVPAQLAKRIIEGVFERPVPPSQIGLLTEVMHWSYGTAWGAAYGILAGTTGRSTLRGGLAFGFTVWTSSYLELVPTGLYEPPWKYPPKVIALDLSYHLVYGTSTATAYRLLP
jgi:uncharacterized membrane protein YagU involved in acid resistance